MGLGAIALLVGLASADAALAVQPSTRAVRGVVTDVTGLPLVGATVEAIGHDALAVSDEEGRFVMALPAGAIEIEAWFPGLRPRRAAVPALGDRDVTVVLEPERVAESVTVEGSAPTARGDRAYELRPLDVVRLPSAQADLMRALQTLPGVMQIDEGAGLFVRGGDVGEVLVLLDGVTVSHPYRYETSTGGFRGAVDTFAIEGLSFSSGGFSERFGNALGVVVDLRGRRRPTDTELTAMAGLAGASFTLGLAAGERAGVRVAANRQFPGLLFALNGTPQRFSRYPGGWDAGVTAGAGTPRLGEIRVFALEARDAVGVEIETGSFVGDLLSESRHRLVTVRWDRGIRSPLEPPTTGPR